MLLNEDEQKLLSRAYFFLKFRLRTEKEMSDYLNKKIKRTHFSQDSVKRVIKHLKDIKLLDDKKFVEMFVEDRKRLNPKSVFLLSRELFNLGITRELISDYFEKNKLNEVDLAYNSAKRRYFNLKNLPKKNRLEKITQFLRRKGFGYGVIKEVMRKYREEG